jgi:oxygen-independent coproporphyrinogen-3 oxidase
VTTWLKRVLGGDSPVGEAEELSVEDRAREAIAIGLRRTAGIDRAEFHQLTGIELDTLAGSSIARLTRSALIEETGSGIRLTREGRFLADTVVAEFL